MIYFASDVHLGLAPDKIDVRAKELQFVNWLKSLNDCTELYLLGDVFDFWFEYRNVVPKGFVRLLGQLASMNDAGVKIHFIAGNHDLWVYDYFSRELNIETYTSDVIKNICGKKVLLSHGDALSGETSFLGKVFRSRFLRWICQHLIHPDHFVRFGYWWSRHNRLSKNISHQFKDEDERLVHQARTALNANPDLDYIICGHVHTPKKYELNDRTRLIILGQWVEGKPVVGRMDDSGAVTLQEV